MINDLRKSVLNVMCTCNLKQQAVQNFSAFHLRNKILTQTYRLRVKFINNYLFQHCRLKQFFYRRVQIIFESPVSSVENTSSFKVDAISSVYVLQSSSLFV